MNVTDKTRDHEGRCQPYLLRLRMLARDETETPFGPHVSAEIRDATNAIIAEAEAGGQVALATTAGGRRQAEAETFLWVRLARLARAADEAVDAARAGDASGLRGHLSRFDALTTAIWVVQQAITFTAVSD